MTTGAGPVQPNEDAERTPDADRKERVGNRLRHGKHAIVAIIVAGITGAGAIVVSRALRHSPLPESVAGSSQAIEQRLRKSGKIEQADEILRACAKPDCACAVVSARRGLDADFGSEVLPLLEAATTACGAEASLSGLRAEALARTESGDRAKTEAEQVLAKRPEDPHALYAMALLHHRAGRARDATPYLERAIASGRGAQARLLSGLVLYHQSDFDGASREFQAALDLEPNDLDALYNLALVSQRRNRHRDAREGYLKVTHLDPMRKDARFNLAVLAHSIGAEDEAKHHLAKLQAIAPLDEKTEKLKAMLAAPATPGASAAPNTAGVLGAAPAGSQGIAR